MAKREYANYQVGLKILLKKEDEYLFLTCVDDKRYDLPGGRIDDVEHTTPLSEIIQREVSEELGEDVRYKLGRPVFQCRRYLKNKGTYVFLTIYEADYLGGEVEMSPEHIGYQWINPKKFDLKREYFTSEEEYLAFNNYFKNLV